MHRAQAEGCHPELEVPHVNATQLDYKDGGRHQSEQPQTQVKPDCPAQAEESETGFEARNPLF